MAGQKGAGSKPGGVGSEKTASSIVSEKKAVTKPAVQDTSQSKSKKSFGESRPLSVQHWLIFDVTSTYMYMCP